MSLWFALAHKMLNGGAVALTPLRCESPILNWVVGDCAKDDFRVDSRLARTGDCRANGIALRFTCFRVDHFQRLTPLAIQCHGSAVKLVNIVLC